MKKVKKKLTEDNSMKIILRAEQSRADNFDILKSICAFLVICIHVPFPGAFGECVTTAARIAVPVFFMITGYFYSDVAEKAAETQQIKKVLKLVIKANFIYLLWDGFCALVSWNLDFFQKTFTLKSLLKFFLLNESPMKGHLWYLGAILYVLIILRAAGRLKCMNTLYCLTPMLLLGDLVFGKYSIVIWGREFPYILVRNFLFVGIPYVCIGQLIRSGMGKRIKKRMLGCLIILFFLTSILERTLLVNSGMNATRDHYISTTFLAVTVFLFALKCDGHKGVLAAIGRKYSTWLYILHPIFITCLGTITKRGGIYGIYKYIAPIVVYIATLVLLVMIEKYENRIVQSRHR